MTDIPIIFSAPMVMALIAGRKTMTRRLAWLPPRVAIQVGDGPMVPIMVPSAWQNVKPGDRLWVREGWRWNVDHDNTPAFRADYPEGDDPPVPEAFYRWRSPIHMARKDSRLTLAVTATKIERLQKISQQDAISEGVEYETADPPFWYVPGIMPHSLTAVGIEEPRGPGHSIQSFAKLWTYINGAGSWEANPEIVALTFTIHKQNIDALPSEAAA